VGSQPFEEAQLLRFDDEAHIKAPGRPGPGFLVSPPAVDRARIGG
jgi:hypothetical protein